MDERKGINCLVFSSFYFYEMDKERLGALFL